MIKIFAKLLNFFPNPRASIDFMRLKAAFLYVKSIKTFRFLFLSFLGIGVCLIFLLTSIVLFHASLFLYSPWSAETKMYVGLVCAAFYFSIALFIFSKVFSHGRWMEIFHAKDILEQFTKEAAQHEPPKEEQIRKREYNSAASA